MFLEENRPWGKFKILLEDKKTKIKKLTIIPGGCLSYQYHNYRSETWIIVEGIATITLNENTLKLYPESNIFVPMLVKHRIKNEEDKDLIIIEVQTGTYFGEDDIVRINDIYNRI
jgi:mannose-6-phosphate isomerase-like protein (cupin superfamily)